MISRAIIRTADKIIEAIEESGLDYVIFGGLALQAWRRLRSTLDIDVMVIAKGDINALIGGILKKGLKLDKDNKEVQLGDITLFRFVYQDEESLLDIKADVAVAKGGFPEKAVRNRIRLNIFGKDMWFVKCEDLIVLKMLSNRPIDIADAKELMCINKEIIDKEYLRKEAAELKISARLKEIESK